MLKLDAVIKDIKDVNLMGNAWIYDDDGNIKDNVICGNVLPWLEELKDYEIDVDDEFINYILENSDNRWNTYNWNANIDHEIDGAEMDIDGYHYIALMVHRYGDVRWNYTDRLVVRFDDAYDFNALESRMQYKEIAERYMCDIDIFCEWYNVWDCENQCDVGEFYGIEADDLLADIGNCK